ncbi:hypothetical protein BH11MYX2_BH11MYX2_20600 [soil metagenome]
MVRVRASLLVSFLALVACKKPPAEHHDAAPAKPPPDATAATDAAVPAPAHPPTPTVKRWTLVNYGDQDSKVLQVEMDHRVACVRRADGHVRCWGSSDAKQVILVPTPTRVTGAPDAVAIHLAHGRFALTSRNGDLAIGSTDHIPPQLKLVSIGDAVDARIDTAERTYVLTQGGDVIPVIGEEKQERVTLNAVAIAAREAGSVDALHRDGTVSVITDGKDIDVKGITDAESLFGTHCAHRRGGGIACWDRRGASVAWTGPTNIIDRVASAGTTCTLASSGVACAGANEVGQLGTGFGPDRADPRVITLTTPAAIAAGERTFCALSDGEVYCWGANDGGQLGISSLVDVPTPVHVEMASLGDVLTGPHDDKLDVSESRERMKWNDLPDGGKQPTTVPAADQELVVQSAYLLTRRHAWELWFADFQLEPGGYRPGYPIERRSQHAVVYALFKGARGKPTKPIVRGVYQNVLVETVTKDWICGTILGAKAKYPFAARFQSPRFP